MTKSKRGAKPPYYETPLKKRSDIIDFIVQNTEQRVYDYRPHPLCFNVKVYDIDFDFEHLLEIYQKENDTPVWTLNEEWLAAAREEYEDVKDNLFEWAIETMRDHFVGSHFFVTYRQLWDGTPIDVVYSFEGRSGGWLSINKFQGHDFTDRDNDFEIMLKEMEYKTLRQLYQLVTMLLHDISRKGLEDEAEHQAAFDLFENCCAQIPKPDCIQPYLNFDSEAV